MSAVRLYAYVARRRRVAVVLRRGPSKVVQLLRWDLASDVFERGQWLRGRVYERRCDLSPRGDLFVYFAAKHRGSIPTWTAISRPPYFTALALWPGFGTYGGGGLFASDDHVKINHRGEPRLAEGYTVPSRVRVSPLGPYSGLGEDDPIQHQRLIREGWRLAEEGEAHRKSFDAPTWIVFDPPRVYARCRPNDAGLTLERRLMGIGQVNGPWYVEEHAIVDPGSGREEVLPGCEWADWDHQGDLLSAREGCLFRSRVVRGVIQAPTLLIDLRGERFRRVLAPPEARAW